MNLTGHPAPSTDSPSNRAKASGASPPCRYAPFGIGGHILVPVDFSPASLYAIRHALWHAAAFHSKLTLLHVVPLPFYAGDANVPPFQRGDADSKPRQEAESRLQQLSLPAKLHVALKVRCGRAWEEIVDYATEEGCDLILIPTHARKGIAHSVWGSVAERVVRLAPCPVMALHLPLQ